MIIVCVIIVILLARDRHWYESFSIVHSSDLDVFPSWNPIKHDETVQMLPYYPRIFDSRTTQRIPRIIVQTDSSSDVPYAMHRAFQRIRHLNPEYDYYFFDNAGVSNFIKSNFDREVFEAYNTIVPGAYKADMFRVCFLLINGGIYLDSGMVANAPLRDIITENDEFISCDDSSSYAKHGNPDIYNAVLMSTPGHPILKSALKRIVQNVQTKNYADGALGVTGPRCIGRALWDAMDGKVDIMCSSYPGGIRLLSHVHHYPTYPCGIITNCSDDDILFYTKYHSYRDERRKNKMKHYSKYFEDRTVFGENLEAPHTIE